MSAPGGSSLQARNLAALYGGHPRLEGRLPEQAAEPPDLQVQESVSGVPTARVAGTFLHSRYDPVREAERAVAGAVREGVTTAVFCGFGLGYQVEAFRRQCPGVPAVIIEPEAALFVAALRRRELWDTLGAPELFWHIGDEPEAVMMTLDALPLGKLRVFRLPAAAPRSVAYFRRLDSSIRTLLDRREVNLNTLKRFGKLWIRNLVANLREFVACPGVDLLRGCFEGIPALVLAAGPSLEELLPELPELRRRMLLVAVDTSFRLCREAGVEPDLLVTVDPQYWNTRHLDWTVLDRAVIVSESSAHPRVFRRLGAAAVPLYFVSSFFPLGRLLEDAVGSKGRVGAGGSVATTAWDLARLLGCRPLYMAGLDLGYPGLRTHCRGAFFEELAHHQSARLQPAETARFRSLHEAGPFLLRNSAGGMTLTDRRLIIYKWWFENQIAQALEGGPTPTFRLAREGVEIEGIPYFPAERLRALAEKRRLIDSKLETIRRRALEHRREAGKTGLKPVLPVLEDLAADLQRLQQLSAEGLGVCRRLRGLPKGSPAHSRHRPGLLARLDRIDADILELSSRNVAGFLFQGLIQRILEFQGAKPSLEEVLQLSEELYDQLERAAGYHLGLIRAATLGAAKALKFPGDPPKLEMEETSSEATFAK